MCLRAESHGKDAERFGDNLHGPNGCDVGRENLENCWVVQHGSVGACPGVVAALRSCMAVRVVHVRHMRMLVHEPLVAMPMRMGRAGRIV